MIFPKVIGGVSATIDATTDGAYSWLVAKMVDFDRKVLPGAIINPVENKSNNLLLYVEAFRSTLFLIELGPARMGGRIADIRASVIDQQSLRHNWPIPRKNCPKREEKPQSDLHG